MTKFIIEKDIAGIEGLAIITPVPISDSRGYFMETYNEQEFEKYDMKLHFVQENQSFSNKGVLRGLHFQRKLSQGKLIYAVRGAFFDVAVDLRSYSRTFGKWYGILLSAENKKEIYIPSGFAHGFLALEDNTIFSAKVTEYHYPNFSDGILWNDPDLNIEWPLRSLNGATLIQSEADKTRKTLKQALKLDCLPI